VAAGDTNVLIAHRLGMRPRTVDKHLEHAYAKLGVGSRTAAVARLREIAH
jgi:DNA-binding CsgD family transcriptional regulator